MKRLSFWLGILGVLVALAAGAWAVTIPGVTNTLGVMLPTRDAGDPGPYQRLMLDCVADSDGLLSASLPRVDGILLRVTVNPGVAEIPTDDFDLVINDAEGVDVLGGLGANLDNASNKNFCPFTGDTVDSIPFTLCGPLTVNATNCGASGSFRITLYIKRS